VKVNQVVQADCREVAKQLVGKVDLVYADILYDKWADVPFGDLIRTLRPGGAFWLQTDQRSVAECKVLLDDLGQGDECWLKFVNWIIWPYDWGGRAKTAFGRKHDDLLYYVRVGGKPTFNAKVVAVDKTVLIRSTKTWKIPTDVWADIGNFYTTSQERIKVGGHCVPWQKPMNLIRRIILSTSKPKDLIFEPYLGTGTACVVAQQEGRRWIGCDTNAMMAKIAQRRLKPEG